ncbi:hypothetical protein RUMGNA_03717 [Mediterraneibacter gnavus ATCC 29149]|nr:hypothetical protein RUMGNA_03717 [Mediterraneibacter gnavus ATCC 29149]
MLNFNPHSREGSDAQNIRRRSKTLDFNPHSREGSDTISSGFLVPYFHFNPHSREGSDTLERICHATVGDFNPHSREGSDTGVEEKLEGYAISIHTPAKGVTCMETIGSSIPRFQSTLPRRE